jgi:hypothetical protein
VLRVNHPESEPPFTRVFLLSPARIGGRRSELLLRKDASFDVAIRLRDGAATLGEVYAFISGLYFRGKMAYVQAFAYAPAGVPPAFVIVPGMGLLPLGSILDRDRLLATGQVPVDEGNQAYRIPLLRDIARLNTDAGPACR